MTDYTLLLECIITEEQLNMVLADPDAEDYMVMGNDLQGNKLVKVWFDGGDVSTEAVFRVEQKPLISFDLVIRACREGLILTREELNIIKLMYEFRDIEYAGIDKRTDTVKYRIPLFNDLKWYLLVR